MDVQEGCKVNNKMRKRYRWSRDFREVDSTADYRKQNVSGERGVELRVKGAPRPLVKG